MQKIDSMKKRYVGIFAIAFCLLLSWLFPLTRLVWDKLDETAYYFFNSMLNFYPFAVVIGVLSQHITDFLFDVVMGVMFIWMLKKAKPKKIIPYLVATFTFLLASFYYVNKKLISKFLAYDRFSPSLVLDGGIDILDKISFGGVKVEAHHCFPGDHATTFFLWVFFMWVFGGKKYGRVALAMAIFFCMPRIIVGAHWLTDVFIGGAVVAAMLLVFGMASGIVESIAKLTLWAQTKFLQKALAKSKREDSPPSK